ncbi:unnamed protein product [Merluccius merluccius]
MTSRWLVRASSGLPGPPRTQDAWSSRAESTGRPQQQQHQKPETRPRTSTGGDSGGRPGRVLLGVVLVTREKVR